MTITGTHFNYHQICHRKLWLFANNIQMEHTSDLVYEGKLIHETSYQRRSEKYTELAVDGIKVDYYDAKAKIIHEVKKSNKKADAHLWQLKYYIYVLEENGIEEVSGILEYPKLKLREEVLLSSIDRDVIIEMKNEIQNILDTEFAPEKLKISKCKNCSYFDFCWSGELETEE